MSQEAVKAGSDRVCGLSPGSRRLKARGDEEVRGQLVQELGQQLLVGPGGLHLAGRVVATEQVGQPSRLLLGQVLGAPRSRRR